MGVIWVLLCRPASLTGSNRKEAEPEGVVNVDPSRLAAHWRPGFRRVCRLLNV